MHGLQGYRSHLSRDFKLLSEQKAEEFLLQLDTWIGERERIDMAKCDTSKQAQGKICGFGVYYFEDDSSSKAFRGLALLFGLRPVAITVAHNTKQISPDERRFQRVVQNRCIPAGRRHEVEQQLRIRMSEFSEEIDDYFTEVESGSAPVDLMTLGIGLYYYEDADAANGKPRPKPKPDVSGSEVT